MKAFVVGIIIAIAAAVVALRVLHQEPLAVDAPNIDSTTAKRRSDSGVMPVEPSPEVRDPGAHAREPEQVAVLPAVSNATKPGPEDWDTPCECWAAWYARQQEREKTARAAEPKDVNWAYEMEQLLAQFIAAHPQTRAIEVSSIECRTTFCEIKAIGNPESSEAFSAIVEQALNEPWSTSTRNSLSSTSRDDGQQDFRAIIRRTSSSATSSATDHALSSASNIDEYECACATPEWQIRKAEIEAAARAAESKDVYWAYATEQRLQHFIAARPQAVVFQVSSIDCRTTFCEIKVVGLTDESTAVFEEIIWEAIAQERFGLTQEMASSSSHSEGRIDMDARVTRKQ